jgi:hypothetical protein
LIQKKKIIYLFIFSGNLDLLCSYMYDYLRPRIIHETNIETLSELCAILQVHLNQDSERNGGINIMSFFFKKKVLINVIN